MSKDTTQTQSSQYINDCHRNFSMYVLRTRSFPSISDGLKAGGRRLLWTARNGEKTKTATLAGATMPLHPHGDASDTIDTLTKPYTNNFPLFTGTGAFGTRLKPNATGAPRYTSVKVSDFTKNVVFADIDLVPMMENYDSTLMEPVHFLPLVPVVLLNPSEGIGVGFSSDVLPRSLGDVVDSQIAHLNGKSFNEPPVTMIPYESVSVDSEIIKSGNIRWWFEGEFMRLDTSSIHISNLPYGLDHAKFIEHLNALVEGGTVVSYEDHSVDTISIAIKFPRGSLKQYSDEQLVRLLKLRASATENMTMVDFTGNRVIQMTYTSTIRSFTDWRLQWYLKRYQLLKEKLERDIQRYRDVILSIKKGVGSVGNKMPTKQALLEWLEGIGVHYTEYVADLPIYRLTVEEAEKVQKKLDAALVQLAEYDRLIGDPDARRKIYIQELKDVKKAYHVPVDPPKAIKQK